MNLFRIFCLIAMISFLTYIPSFADETITNLSNRNYFENVHKAFGKARESIFVVMHLITVNPNNKDSLPYQLLLDLIEAKDRGVKVRVVLEDSVDKNKEAFQVLSDNGVDVKFDSNKVYTHSKLIVVDNERVILGSANWTYSALSSGNESSVMINSKGFAQSVLKDAQNIETETLSEPLDKNQILKVPIAREFMYNKKLAGRLVSANDERAFDVYLLLLYVYGGAKDGSVNVDYEKLAGYLGLDTKKEKGYACKRQIMRALYKLDKNYSLIDTSLLKEKTIINLLSYKDNTMYYEVPEREYFNIPIAYFEYGWIRKISLRAKYALFINLYETELSMENPVWSGSLNYLSKKFNVSAWLINKGMRELRKAWLLEVIYSEVKEGYEGRHSNKYRIKELFSEDKQRGEREELRKEFGKERIGEAEKLAGMIDEGSNLTTVRDFVLLIEEYGLDKVLKANKITAQKAADNPKRHIRYTVGILKEWKNKLSNE